MYRYIIVSVNGNETETLGTVAPLSIGDIIGWGADEQEEDRIKKWIVIQQIY